MTYIRIERARDHGYQNPNSNLWFPTRISDSENIYDVLVFKYPIFIFKDNYIYVFLTCY